jgi:GxxExxY protein
MAGNIYNIKADMLMELNHLSSQIIKAAIAVHKELGPGLLESVYQSCIIIELRNMGMKVESEVPILIYYRGQKISQEGFRLDLLVENTIIVELKSVEKVQPVHKKQLLTYLRLAKKPLGLLINFNEVLLKDGISRIINAPSGADCLD